MTEDKLISADNLKKAFRTDDGAEAVNHSIRNLLYVDKVIDQQPAVEARPVIHAKWNYDGTCDNCKAQVLSNHTKFCPACGAKMDGE